jgi:hypothetical protein
MPRVKELLDPPVCMCLPIAIAQNGPMRQGANQVAQNLADTAVKGEVIAVQAVEAIRVV